MELFIILLRLGVGPKNPWRCKAGRFSLPFIWCFTSLPCPGGWHMAHGHTLQTFPPIWTSFMTLAEKPMTVAISPSENVLDFSAVWALDMGNKQISIITTNNGSQSAFDYRKYWTLDTKISKTIGSILLDLYQTDINQDWLEQADI